MGVSVSVSVKPETFGQSLRLGLGAVVSVRRADRDQVNFLNQESLHATILKMLALTIEECIDGHNSRAKMSYTLLHRGFEPLTYLFVINRQIVQGSMAFTTATK